MDLKSRLKKIIADLGLDNADFAAKCGVSTAQIYKYLSGDQEPGTKFYRGLKESFPQVNIDWLISGSEDLVTNYPKRERSDSATSTPIIEHINNLVNKFVDHESAIIANEYLLNMEKKSPKDFLLAVGYLKGVSDSIDRKSQDQSDRRKRTMDWASPERRKKTAS